MVTERRKSHWRDKFSTVALSFLMGGVSWVLLTLVSLNNQMGVVAKTLENIALANYAGRDELNSLFVIRDNQIANHEKRLDKIEGRK